MSGRGKDRPAVAKPFVVAFDSEKGWRVKQGENWRRATEVSVLAPALTNHSGEIVGLGVVTRKGSTIVITA